MKVEKLKVVVMSPKLEPVKLGDLDPGTVFKTPSPIEPIDEYLILGTPITTKGHVLYAMGVESGIIRRLNDWDGVKPVNATLTVEEAP